MFEQWKIIGFRKLSFQDQQTGKQVNGYSLFMVRPGSGENMTGDEAQKLFISSEYVDYVPCLGDQVQLIYNRYGKISSIQAC